MLPIQTKQWLICACVVSPLLCHEARAGNFVYTTIDVPNATATYPESINDLGAVAGVYEAAPGRVQYGFTWSNGAVITFAAHVPANSLGTSGIDNRGRVAFSAGGIRKDTSFAKVRHPDGAYSVLPTPVGQLAWSSAISDGRIVGGYEAAPGAASRTGFLYSQGQLQTLAYPGAALTMPSGIAKDGTVIGNYAASDIDPAHGFVYRNGAYTSFDPPHSTYTMANAINRRGDIAGTFYTADLGTGTLGYVFSKGKYHIYALQRGKEFVNEVHWAASFQDVAGNFYNLFNQIGFTFVNGHYYQVLPFGAVNSYIFSGNAAGTLVGTYSGSDGVSHGFIAVCPAGQAPCTN